MEPPAAVADFQNGKVDGVDADAEPAGGAGHRGRRARHRQEGRHLPRDAARRRLRAQDASPTSRPKRRCCRSGSGKPVKVVWTAKTTCNSTSTTRPPPCTTRRSSTRRASRRRGCTGRRSSRSRRRSTGTAKYPLPFELDLGADRRCRTTWRTSGPRTGRPTRTCASAGSAPSPTTSTCSRSAASPTRWRTPPAAIRSSSCSTCSGPGKVLDLKAQGVEYSNYGAPYDKYPIDTRRLRRVLESGRREERLGEAQEGQRPRHGHCRAPQLQHLRGVGGARSRWTARGGFTRAAHRAGGGLRRHREPGPRALADGRRRGDGRRPGAHRRDHGAPTAGSSRPTSTSSRWRA